MDLGEKKQGSENVAKRSENEGVSWAEIAQEKKVLKKYDLKIEDLEGGKAVEIPDEVIEQADLLWDDYLIGKFLDTAPHVARVHAIVNRIWNQGEMKQQIDKEDSKSKEKEMEENIGSTKKSSDLETIKEMEVEEGEIEENWQDVTPKKACRSSTLKFGQVKILTPSRFPNLLEVDEKGDVINVVETEEILSVVEEIMEEGVDTERVIEENKEKEKEDIDAERKENDCEMQKEENKFEENQNQGIAGIQITQENWPDLASASKIRPSLPRRSKTLHRAVQVPESFGNMGKRSKNSSQ
ncbi:hypothetical protein Bca52824_075636 [Brassica carinata]|uniref:Uncharacterized protein n=1 Tax=Brassica carinata TaxID=52824 RepID=A0A8X7PSJ1_BRACI|nr:hypothetical protein Bca52824_075636 [Brassica carinata]